MSTKLYDGLRFDGSFTELLSALKTIRADVKKEYLPMISRHVSNDVTFAHDALYAGIPIPEINEAIRPYLASEIIEEIDVVHENHKLYATGKKIAEHLCDFYKTSIIAFPLKENTFLLYPFFTSHSIQLDTYEGFSEYGYWNNVNQPDHVTDEQWAQRKADWDATGSGRFIDNGFYYLLFDREMVDFQKDVTFMPPSIEKREEMMGIQGEGNVKLQPVTDAIYQIIAGDVIAANGRVQSKNTASQ